MSLIKIKVAECNAEIETIYPLLSMMWHKFYTEEPADIRIRISPDDIDREKPIYSPLRANDAYCNSRIETLLIHRALCKALLDHGTFMIHGAAIDVNNKGILFCGKSGVGKTTHMLNWLDHCPNAGVICGDKPFIRAENKPMVYGSPWAGKENMCMNSSAPVRAIVFLQRAQINQIDPISFTEAFPLLLQQVYRPDDEEKMRKTLHLLQRLSSGVSFWRFRCNNFKDDCFDVAYNALVGSRE